MLEGIRFALGPAVALRRDSLEKIGGIAATADYYSDDFVLGNLIWAAGYKVVFSSHHSTRAYPPLFNPNLGRPVAMDEKHSLLASAGACGHRPDLRCAVRSSRAGGRSGNGSFDARGQPFSGCIREPDGSIHRSGMGNYGRPAGVVLGVALSGLAIFWDSLLGQAASAVALFFGAEKLTGSAGAGESFRRTGRRRARWERSFRALSIRRQHSPR